MVEGKWFSKERRKIGIWEKVLNEGWSLGPVDWNGEAPLEFSNGPLLGMNLYGTLQKKMELMLLGINPHPHREQFTSFSGVSRK